jgi:hypothetical protein
MGRLCSSVYLLPLEPPAFMTTAETQYAPGNSYSV